MKNGGKNNEIENRNKTVVNQENENINSKTDENKIQENSNDIKIQTLDLSHTNNQDQSETKNKGWIKFFKALKIIALVGFILALVMTAVSISVATLSATTIKFAITAVVLFCIFLLSKFMTSCLSNKKPKENKNPYQGQFDTDFEKRKDKNFDINKSVDELNINQMAEREKKNLLFIEDNLN